MRMGFLVLCLATGALPAEGLHIRQNLEVGQEESLRGKQVNYLIVKIGRLKRDLVRLEARLQKMEEESRDGSESKAAVKREFGALDRRIDLLEKRIGIVLREWEWTERERRYLARKVEALEEYSEKLEERIERIRLEAALAGKKRRLYALGGLTGAASYFFAQASAQMREYERTPGWNGSKRSRLRRGYETNRRALDAAQLLIAGVYMEGLVETIFLEELPTKATVEDGFSLRVENGEVRLGYTILLGDEK